MKYENERYILTVIKQSSSDYQVLLSVGVGVNHLDRKVFKSWRESLLFLSCKRK